MDTKTLILSSDYARLGKDSRELARKCAAGELGTSFASNRPQLFGAFRSWGAQKVVHACTDDPAGGRSKAGLSRHRISVSASEVCERAGLRYWTEDGPVDVG